jgi:16S rRNA (cytidine1402-2'-O)-methyltransferase
MNRGNGSGGNGSRGNGKLFVVGTPIGNLGDMTFRAVEVLKSVDFVLAEDTRVSKKLLDHYGIETPVISYPADDRKDKINKFINLLEEGKSLALVSDAGTPAISDPGAMLVKEVRNHFTEGDVEIVAVPGASALTATLSIAGLSDTGFVFLGFLPHKKGRETLFKMMADEERPVVLYESPHRIIKTLEALVKFVPKKQVSVARELTKMHEQFIKGSAEEVLKYFTDNEDKVRGEFVVVVSS